MSAPPPTPRPRESRIHPDLEQMRRDHDAGVRMMGLAIGGLLLIAIGVALALLFA